MPAHPHGVKPEGNLFLLEPAVVAAARAQRASGLGPLMAKLTDTLLLRILSFAGTKTLATLCSTSDTLSAFASFEEFWQAAW